MKNRKKQKAEPSALGALAAAPRGMAVFAAAALVTSFPAAIIAYATPDPGSYVLPCGLCALYISSAAGGFAAYKFHGGLALLSGLFCGLDKKTAVRFSFLMSIPAILGALFLTIKDIFTAPSQTLSFLPVAVGMITAALSGYFAIKFLLRLVEKSKLSYFSIYCTLAGIFAIILNFTI